MAVELQRRLFTVEEYDRMGEAGILGPHDRVELLRGEIVKKVTIGDRHRACVNRLIRILRRFEDRAVVQVQNPVAVLDDSEPEPDIALLEINEASVGGGRHAYAQDVFALIEVSDASREVDVRIKGSLYAEAGIREYWVVDLIDRVVLVHRDPSPQHYRMTAIARPGEHIAFAVFPGDPLSVDEILGPKAP
jgi:Uma2 family endonuclease